MESPGSPLSEHSSDEFEHELEPSPPPRGHSPDPYRDHSHSPPDTTLRPSKRPRLSASTAWDNLPLPPSDAEISSDTDGSVPGSPHYGGGRGGDDDDDGAPGGREQVTVCKWEGCIAGDLGNMDQLVQHLHDEHIQARQKKYSCEWADCTRKGIAHASGYALRAHMRSHTREKPFYCSLPECDRSFTRSDALAKHMRTVHETEALRPSDPVPKHHSSNPQNKAQRIKLTLKGLAPAPNANGATAAAAAAAAAATAATAAATAPAESSKDPVSAVKSNASNPNSPNMPPTNGQSTADLEYEHNNVTYERASVTSEVWVKQFPPDISFTPEELSLPADALLELLKMQVGWAMQDGDELRREVEVLEKLKKVEWVKKELLLENVLESEFAVLERKNRVTGDNKKQASVRDQMRRDVEKAKRMKIKGEEKLWWRQANGHAETVATDGHTVAKVDDGSGVAKRLPASTSA